MINSFADKDLQDCWQNQACEAIKEAVRHRTLLMLSILDAATSLEDVLSIPGCQLTPLHSNQKGIYSMVIDGPWHLVFRYENGAFHEVWLKEYRYEV